MPELKRFLKSKDVAHLLDCSPDDVNYLAKKNRLQGIKMGKYWTFQFKDIEEFKRKNKKAE